METLLYAPTKRQVAVYLDRALAAEAVCPHCTDAQLCLWHQHVEKLLLAGLTETQLKQK